MAFTGYSVNMSDDDLFRESIVTALLDFYGAYDVTTNPTGADVLYNSGDYLIFTCSALGTSYYKLFASNRRPQLYYGTGYTSGTSLDGELGVSGSNAAGSPANGWLVLGPEIMFLAVGNLGDQYSSRCCIVGKLSNGNSAVMSWYGIDTSNYYIGHKGYDITDGVDIYIAPNWFLAWSGSNGYINYQPMYLVRSNKALYHDGTDPVLFTGVNNYSIIVTSASFLGSIALTSGYCTQNLFGEMGGTSFGIEVDTIA